MQNSTPGCLRKVLPSLLLIAGSAAAQIGGGSIVGMVRDASDAPVANVQVVAHGLDTNEERIASTNQDGYYEFPLLAAGRYYLKAEVKGFRKVQVEPFMLSTGTRPRIDLSLVLGDVSEKVEVTATAPLIRSISPIPTARWKIRGIIIGYLWKEF